MILGALLAVGGAAEPDRARGVLRAVLVSGDTEFWVAMHAAEGLTRAGHGAEVREALLRREELAEADDRLRCGLARERFRAGDGTGEGVLRTILADPASPGRIHAAESLFKVGWREEATTEVLRRASGGEGGDARLRIMAAAALASRGEDEARTVLRGLLAREHDPAVFTLAAWALGRVGEAADAERVRGRLRDAPDVRSRAFLEHALARLGDEEGRRALVDNLGSPDAAVRIQAAEFAGEAGIEEARGALQDLLDDAEPDARVRAAQALILLDTRTEEERR
jgi:sialidase-1